MKKRKVLSFLTAAVLTVGAVPFSVIHAAAADETYVQGDVDMDGYITGHDAAMVSRYLNVDPELLSDQQKALADMNGDGVLNGFDLALLRRGGSERCRCYFCAEGLRLRRYVSER